MESISTPKLISAPSSLSKENLGTLTPIISFLLSYSLYFRSVSIPNIHLVAIFIKLIPNVLDTKGKLLDTLRLHSITFTSSSLAINWILNGPLIFKERLIISTLLIIFIFVSSVTSCVGKIRVESPE